MRPLPATLGALLVLSSGCPEDAPPAEEGSSTGGSTSSSTASLDPSTSNTSSSSDGLDETTTTSSSSTTEPVDTTATDDTTTGVESTGQARFVVRERNAVSGGLELLLFEYADGELMPPSSLTPGLPPGGGVTSTLFAASGRAAAYCTNDPAMTSETCFAIDLTTHPPGPSQPLVAGPPGRIVQLSSFVEATDTFVFQTLDVAGVLPRELYAAPFPGGVLALPQMVAQSLPNESFGNNLPVRPDGAWIGYVLTSSVGPTNAFIASLQPPDPDATVGISDLVDPEPPARNPLFVPGHEAVIYAIDSALPGPTDTSLWYVDISGPMPAAPIRIDDPLTGADVRGPQIAPDGHALIYWVDTGTDGDLMFVDLSTGAPQAPVLVSTLGANQTSSLDFGWSPDSRLVVYRAAHEQPDTYDLHVVEAPGSTPGAPMLASGGLIPGGEISVLTFDASSTWIYYIAQEEDQLHQLYRVDVSGAEPGMSQRVSGRTGWLPGEIIPSPDWSMVLYTAEPANDETELYLVDVSGPVPAEAIHINAPVPAGSQVNYGAKFSRDGSVVLYRERPANEDDPYPVRLVDLASLKVLPVSDDASGVFPIVD